MYRTPKHIGIIPDGNRRWAKKNGLNKEDGYIHGLEPARALIQAVKRRGVEELTFYGFTVDNCKRPKEQVAAFSKACIKAAEIAMQENAALYVVGNTCSACFPKDLIEFTQHKPNPRGGKLKVNLLVNYGWEWDMKNGWASRAIPRIDLVIRWGGMCRLSGFLPIQTVYSDFYIVKDLWPDFRGKQLEDAIEWYQKQDITLGG